MNINYIGKNNFYYASVFLLAVSLPLSVFLISFSTGLILISFLITGQFSQKWKQLKSEPAALLLISIFFVYVFGLLFTQDMELAQKELQKTAFILIIPLCLSVGPPINYKLFRKILIAFVVSLNLAILVALVRLIFREYFDIQDIWKITFVSHIVFSFELLLGIAFLINELYKNSSISKNTRYLLFANILYLIAFLFILKSLTGLVTFAALLIIHLFFIIRKIKNRKSKVFAGILLPVLILGGFGYVGWCIHEFYNTDRIDTAHLPLKTQNGNLYSHDLENKQLENGHYIRLFVCEEELKKSWEERSKLGYKQEDVNGFPISETLIRYLTSKGLTKDSVGMSKLLPEDIGYVEKGIANYIYTQRFLSLYPRIYQTIWELDVYFKTGNPNLKSVSKRIEFGKAALTIIQEHPFFGVGTGNWKQAFTNAYQKNNSQLQPEQYGSSHNQYLNYLVKFGTLGFFWIIFAWVYPLFLKNKQHFYPVVMLLLIFGIANFSDSNLEAHTGISFFVFFYSLLLFCETQQPSS